MSVNEMSVEVEEDEVPKYKKKDFMSDQVIRWCPGCGDYSILSQVQTVMADLGRKREEFAVISGIGCSSRFPYYMNTYGFHTIHGRAPAFATGLKSTRPELSVWLVTGDGDGLSIGGNHLAHVLRRDVDIQILLFNNRIYGLTKGQYSPTSEVGKKTKSTPLGSLDNPFNPARFALGCGATFIARSADRLMKELRDCLVASYEHRGASFLEIYQNCNIFNDMAFEEVIQQKDKVMRAERLIFLEHGKPMVFGAPDAPKGLRLNGLKVEVVELGGEFSEADLLVHDEADPILASILVQLDYPDYPVPMGILYRAPNTHTYDSAFQAQVQAAKDTFGEQSLKDIIYAGDMWTVE
jgi:2-oxoglutarate ferredoxin oxidoreductase subunit beta